MEIETTYRSEDSRVSDFHPVIALHREAEDLHAGLGVRIVGWLELDARNANPNRLIFTRIQQKMKKRDEGLNTFCRTLKWHPSGSKERYCNRQ
jgi:hypothetical protein